MRRQAVLLAFVLLAFAGAARAQQAMLVLDGSASMWGRLDGRAKIDVAREAVAALMVRWPAERPIGLMTYGHRRTQDCADVELLRAPAADAGGMAALARGIVPRGRTPLAEAVRQAAAALGAAGGSIILVTDGIETCHPDPCAVAQDIARSGVRLVVHTVAFALTDPAALAQLRCMAEATGGRAMTARDAAELAAGLDRAAEAPVPGPRHAAPRAEPVPQPSLIVTLRLCPSCDPMTGDASIVVRRGEEVVATGGDPFGRFFDLPAADYTVTVEAGLFTRGPVPVTLQAGRPGRAEIVLDAGWLVGEVRSEPSDEDVTGRVRLEWHAGAAAPEGQPRAAHAQGTGPSFLVPAGTHRLVAGIGNATGAAEADVAAGEVVMLRVPIRFGALALRREGFGSDTAHVAVTTADEASTPIYDDRPTGERVEIPLAPGSYRVMVDQEERRASTVVTIAAEGTTEATLQPQE
jgi:Ca-activated chloride channel family protein